MYAWSPDSSGSPRDAIGVESLTSGAEGDKSLGQSVNDDAAPPPPADATADAAVVPFTADRPHEPTESLDTASEPTPDAAQPSAEPGTGGGPQQATQAPPVGDSHVATLSDSESGSQSDATAESAVGQEQPGRFEDSTDYEYDMDRTRRIQNARDKIRDTILAMDRDWAGDKRDHCFSWAGELQDRLTNADLGGATLGRGTATFELATWKNYVPQTVKWLTGYGDSHILRHVVYWVRFEDGSLSLFDDGWWAGADGEVALCNIPPWASCEELGIRAYESRDPLFYECQWYSYYIGGDLLYGL